MNAKRPNILFFFTDQQRWDSTGVHGNPLDLTPNFDRMAAHGTHVANAFTPQPVCGPARACIQTGQYATRNGTWKNGIPLSAESPHMARVFAEAGYRTGYIGKWHLGPRESLGPVAPEFRGGYQDWLAANVQEHVSDCYHPVLYDNDGQPVFLPGYRVDGQTDAAIRYLHDHKDHPFFLFLSFLEPHHRNARDDYPAPRGYAERYHGRWTPPDLAALPAWDGSGLAGGTAQRDLGGYYGMVKRLDEALGRIQDALHSLDLEENTIMVFTSDHGCHFKTRNGEYKRSCHEGSIRVPMAIDGPGFRGGGRIRQLASLLDLPPTLIDAAGLFVPAPMQGRSMLPLLRGGGDAQAPWPQEVLIQISEAEVGRAVRTGRWKYGVTAPGKDPWKEACSDSYIETYLYDLESDPCELQNLVGFTSHRHVADALRERLLRRIAESGETTPVINLVPERKSGRKIPAEAAHL